MDRRSFLAGTGTLALSQLLAACGEQDRAKLRVQLLKGSIPAQVVNKFRTLNQRADLQFSPVAQLKELFFTIRIW
jgi:putative spermidine/putrescine transport system substrate-binding protein